MMDSTLRRKLLAYIAGATVSVGAGPVAMARVEVNAIPETLLSDVLDETEVERWRGADVVRLIDLLAVDPRRRVRQHLVELLSSVTDPQLGDRVEEIFLGLLNDEDRVVRNTAGQSFAEWLGRVDGLTRAAVVAEWAVSEHSVARQAVVMALASGVDTLGVDLILDHLSRDSSSVVRRGVAEAAAVRAQRDPGAATAVLRLLAADPDRAVRRTARRRLVRSAAVG